MAACIPFLVWWEYHSVQSNVTSIAPVGVAISSSRIIAEFVGVVSTSLQSR